MKPEEKRLLDELASKLSLNLANSSLRDLIDRNQGRDILESQVVNGIFLNKKIPKNLEHSPQRLIVIVGAGASFNASNQIPLGRQAASILLDKFKDISELIELEIDKLSKVYRLEPDDFETILLAISKLRPKKLVDEIYKLYNHKHYPSLCYEILAHLFKHRFVDAIINFNFDELLDQSIEDELLHGEYFKIISDGDVQQILPQILADGRIRSPVYIKPHGTVSHKSTMRFTGEDYFGLPADIEYILKLLVSGATSVEEFEAIEEKRETTMLHSIPVNLIVIGFKMQSFEFNHILKEYLPKNSSIYHFNTQLPEIDQKLKDTFKNKAISFNNPFEVKRNPSENTGRLNLNDWMLRLWEFIENNFEDKFSPRNIIRHKLISALFEDKPGKLKSKEEVLLYLKDRMYIELALSIAKYKGFLNVNQLARDRFGKYYSEYCEEMKSGNKPSLITVCKKLGLKDIGYSREALTAKTKKLSKSLKLTFGRKKFENKYIPRLYEEKLTQGNLLSDRLAGRLKKGKNKELFFKSLKMLRNDEDTEIHVKHNSIYDNVFSNPIVLSTHLALDYFTNYLFEAPAWGRHSSQWDVMLIIAETGEWLINKIDKKFLKGKEVRIIIADTAFENILDKRLKTCCKHHEILTLRWWEHNQHLTIFLKKGDKGILKPVKSIYFTRRLRSTYILPVILDCKDSKVILETFAAYHIKSERQNTPNSSQIITQKDVSNRVKYLLGKKSKFEKMKNT